ncbi:MAG: hypothetical protein N7Q72_01465, partial [Spiroplasma sp. Tabriz.8]|nr:hypothetical protein [Candidatus Regiella insecticola]MCZ8631912.1 hypothetical protein [Spiroplasma sp. Tabriz.8]
FFFFSNDKVNQILRKLCHVTHYKYMYLLFFKNLNITMIIIIIIIIIIIFSILITSLLKVN